MKVIIPLAGKGTRMRPHTHTRAKPLLHVAGKPILDHVMDRVKGLDVSEYLFITGHLKEQIEEHITENYDINARFIEQKVKDGTAGACRLAKPYVTEPVLIVFVDTIFDADLGVIASCKDDGLIWAQEVEDYRRFGVIVHDKQGYVTNFVEKPSEPISKLANIGLYYIRDWKGFFKGIAHVYENGLKVKGEYFLPEAFMHMVKEGAKLKVLPVTGWYDCGKPETTLASNAVLLKKRHAVKSTTKNTEIIAPVYIEEGCTIEDSEIGPNVSITTGCTVKNAKLADCILDEGATVQDIALRDSILGRETLIEGAGTGQEFSMRLGCHARTTLRKGPAK